METINTILAILFMAAISLQCQKEFSSQFITNPAFNNQPAAITATLQGNILDSNGLPAAGVKISVGTKVVITNSNGLQKKAVKKTLQHNQHLQKTNLLKKLTVPVL
ncbi:MAG: hypothetical protein ABJB11_15730 [Ferruginibacter sp.]